MGIFIKTLLVLKFNQIQHLFFKTLKHSLSIRIVVVPIRRFVESFDFYFTHVPPPSHTYLMLQNV